MLFKTKNSLIAFAFAIVVCVKCPAVMNVRQSVGDISGMITLDFSSFWRVKYPADRKAYYERGLLSLLNKRIGVYQCDSIPHGVLPEWGDAEKLRLSIDKSANVSLDIVDDDGKISSAPMSENGFLTESTLFLGPRDNGLLFLYGFHSNVFYTLFSPNGVQVPLSFRKIGNLPLADMLPTPHCNPNEFEFEYRARLNAAEGLKQTKGWYRCISQPKEFQEDGVDEYCIKINGENDVVALNLKKGVYWYDQNFAEFLTMGIHTGPHGRYSFDGKRLSFCCCPPSYDEFAALQLDVERALGSDATKIMGLQDRIAKVEKFVRRDINLYWSKGKRGVPKILFERTAPPKIGVENLRISRAKEDVTTKMSVEWLLERLK